MPVTSLLPKTSPLSNMQQDASELETLGHCSICQRSARTVLYENLTDKLFRCTTGRWTSHACNGCGMAYPHLRPSLASIGKTYAHRYSV